MAEQQSGPRRILVWDLPTRLFHWCLVLLVAFSWWSGEQGHQWRQWHFLSGYAVLALLIFRFGWGLVGSATARFAHFLKGPAAALDHVREMFGPRPPSMIGHNPLGGWMVGFMLTVLLVQVGTGLFAFDSRANTGPLYRFVSIETAERITAVHQWGEKIIVLMVLVHVAAIAAYWLLRRINLLGPMISGYNEAPPGARQPAIASPRLAMALIVIAGLAVWGITSLR